MTRFNNFTDEELDAMEEAFCNEGLKSLVFEIRRERGCRERIQNGTPLSEELEKIKEEFLSECPNTNTRIICMSIIDNHIAELKGDNNAE